MNRLLRTVPRLVPYRAFHRTVSGRQFSSKFGYECNTLSNADYDVTFLEKSIRAQNRFVLTKSGHCEPYFDLLLDLLEFDEIDLNEFTVAHVCKLPKVSMRSEKISTTGDHMKVWMDELTRVHAALHKRNKAMDVLLVQLPQLEHLSTADIAGLLQSFHSYLQTNSSIYHRAPRLGLDLDSTFLYGLSDAQVDHLISLLEALPSSTAAAQLGALSVAGSALTYRPAARLVQWARSKGLHTIATEVLRCHPRRPSQIATNYSFVNEHKPMGEDRIFKKPELTLEVAESTAISKEEKQRMLQIMDSTNDLTMSLDRCVKVEKKLLNELHPQFKPSVNPSSICLAHILGSNVNQFLFPEEFNHIASTQIIPHLKDAVSVLDQSEEPLKDWCSLYKSMHVYLISSYRTVLQNKALRLSQSLQDQILAALPELTKFSNQTANKLSTNSLDDMAMFVSLISALSVGADQTVVTFTKVESDKWSTALDQLKSVDQSRLMKVMGMISETLRQEWTAAESTAASKQLK